ncbi:MAG: hypothetical protein MJA83_18285, partial [Gammaproteobacteria bacterium]|nr:hypothetical protein [Gammaproteobacteria bacterium]
MLRRSLIIAQVFCLVANPAVAAEEIDEIFVTAVRRAVDSDQLSISIDTIAGESVRNDKLATDAFDDAVGVSLQQTTPGQGAAIVRGQKGSAV